MCRKNNIQSLIKSIGNKKAKNSGIKNNEKAYVDKDFLKNEIKDEIKSILNIYIKNKGFNKIKTNNNPHITFEDSFILNKEKYKTGYNYPINPNHKYGYRILYDIYIFKFCFKRLKNQMYPKWVLNNKDKLENGKKIF